MRAVRRSYHNVSQLHYHFVTPVKYRKGIFGQPDREQSLHAICQEIEERYEIEFEQVGIDTNHVHWLLSAAPKYAPSAIIRLVKSITAKQLFRRYPDLRRELWGGELWTEGSSVASVGEHGNLDVIRAYVKQQGLPTTQLKLFNFDH